MQRIGSKCRKIELCCNSIYVYVKQNIINDAMQSEINATNERMKRYTSLRSITNLKKRSCREGGFGINNWLSTLDRPTIDYVVFPSL